MAPLEPSIAVGDEPFTLSLCERASDETCAQSSEVAAYLDGELDAAACLVFEEHTKECSSCRARLNEQRRLLAVLDGAFGDFSGARFGRESNDNRLPANFARVVTARAMTDMTAVRSRVEGRRALRVCAWLVCLVCALSGITALAAKLEIVGSLLRLFASVARVTGQALYEVCMSLAVLLRVLRGHLTQESHVFVVSACVLFAASLILLWRLVGRYHREQATEQMRRCLAAGFSPSNAGE